MLAELLLLAGFTLMLAWYPCCCGGWTCVYCSTEADTVSVTFTGWGDYGSCTNCNETFNVTFVLSKSETVGCRWIVTGNWDCGGSISYSVTADATQVSGSNLGWKVTLSLGPLQTNEYIWNSGSTSAFDCTATRTATISVGTPPGYCYTTTTTCTVN